MKFSSVPDESSAPCAVALIYVSVAYRDSARVHGLQAAAARRWDLCAHLYSKRHGCYKQSVPAKGTRSLKRVHPPWHLYVLDDMLCDHRALMESNPPEPQMQWKLAAQCRGTGIKGNFMCPLESSFPISLHISYLFVGLPELRRPIQK